MSKYLNTSKEDRARRVVAKPENFPAESVERTSLALGVSEGHKGEDLVEFIYRRIGGAVVGEKPAKAETPEYSAETSGKEVEEVGKPRRTRRAA